MCSKYIIKISAAELKHEDPDLEYDHDDFEGLIHPSEMAPVVVLQNSKRKLTPMRFSLVPHWSAEPKVKFATHNARIETISEKPAWKLPFLSRHCLVPLSGFYEAVYVGPMAGHIIKFTPKNGGILWAVGIFDYWQDPEPTEKGFFSFAILTREPSSFILDHGHDRTPIFVRSPQESAWLTNINKNPGDIARDLIAEAYHPELKVEIDRPLKAGWEKRI